MADDRGVNATGRARPVEPGPPREGITVGDLAGHDIVSVAPDATLRATARTMHERGVGSAVVLSDGELAGIATERDLLRAVATGLDLDQTPVSEIMTDEVVTAEPDWEVYEAAAAMADRRIRHLVVVDGIEVVGVLSVRDVLLAGQRVQLTGGSWAVLRDPLTFTIRERRRLQRALRLLGGAPRDEVDLDELIGVLVASWSFDLPLPADADALEQLTDADRQLLREAVREELPDLQRAVQPAPGWRTFVR